MVEGTEFNVILLAWQLAGNHCRWSASPYYGTIHSFLTTMVMSSLLNFSVVLGAVRLLMLHDCKLNG